VQRQQTALLAVFAHKRLCWHIGGSSGGWRLGTLVCKKNNFNFSK